MYAPWRSRNRRSHVDHRPAVAGHAGGSDPCQQGTWTIEVTVPAGNGWRSIGDGTVEVLANRISNLEIVLTGAP